MKVLKRSGSLEDMCLNKITERLSKLCRPLAHMPALSADCVLVAQKTCAGLSDGIATSRIDEISSEVAIGLTTTHPDYESLAARILTSDLHKKTSESVLKTFRNLAGYRTDAGIEMPLISKSVLDVVEKHHERLQASVNYDNDHDYSYFGLKTLLKGYLQPKDQPMERPQHMLLRVALGIWFDDIDNVVATYNMLSQKLYTHATPSLFNLGTCRPHSASCYLMGTEDSIEAIAETWKKSCIISKSAGGIGLNVSNIRGSNALIHGTGGRSNGLVPMAQTFNMLTKWVTQGGKRQGALAMYLEPWHVDVFSFIQLRRPQGAEDLRTRNLFLALWVNDLFMERVNGDGLWSLMDPDACRGLTDVWGDAFRELYTDYERRGMFIRQVRAQELWTMILRCQIESGMPYIVNKCTANATSNQQNLGTIKCSNLCSEIIQYSDHHQTSVCNLASVALPKFISDGRFDHARLHTAVQQVVRNLDHMLDVCAYPVPDAKATNERDRPLGVGVQGLADVFIMLKLPFESEAAARLNRHIFETMYHAALTASSNLAHEHGTYPSYEGSPISKGQLQFDLWHQTDDQGRPFSSSGLWDWPGLREQVHEHGVRNSLLMANMPTCSTSQILNNNESFQPVNSNIYSRRTGAGSFVCVNRHLVEDLQKLGLWDTEMKEEIIRRDGSVQGIASIPHEIQQLYKTIWEIKQKACIDMAADRAPFICQSQSLNLFLPEASVRKLSAMIMHAWKRRLVTLVYYTHVMVEAKSVQVTVAPTLVAPATTDCESCCA